MAPTESSSPTSRVDRLCPDCGTPIPAHAPGGNCLACLLAQAGGGGPPDPIEDPPPLSPEDWPQVENYHLVRRIGEGGFGEVFLARQDRPVRREVALKILKPGMDSRQVIARFEAERQALALMDHPCVAKHLSTRGSTVAGSAVLRRWSTSTRHPDPSSTATEHSADASEERLRSLPAGCVRACSTRTKKAILHRDLKPSNILVTEHDGKPARPKIIDFGVAKALAAAS